MNQDKLSWGNNHIVSLWLHEPTWSQALHPWRLSKRVLFRTIQQRTKCTEGQSICKQRMNKMRIHTCSSYLVVSVSGCISLHLTNSDYSDYHHLHNAKKTMQHNGNSAVAHHLGNSIESSPAMHWTTRWSPDDTNTSLLPISTDTKYGSNSLISGHVQIMYIFYIFYIFYMCSFIVRTSSDCSVSSACSIHVASNFGRLVPHLKEQTA